MCFGYHQFCNISSHVCQPAGAGVIQTVSNVTSGRDCPLLCRNHRRCMFSTFTNFRGEPKCYLLSSCDVKVRFILLLPSLVCLDGQCAGAPLRLPRVLPVRGAVVRGPG